MTEDKIKKEFGYDGKPLQWKMGFDALLRHMSSYDFSSDTVYWKQRCEVVELRNDQLVKEIYRLKLNRR